MPDTAPARAPRTVLLAGLRGSGKTTLSRALVDAGFARLCPDEGMFRRYGHYGLDFPRGEFKVREAPVLADTARRLSALLAGGHDVVLDHGLWDAGERARWAEVVTEAGGEPVLGYLPVPHAVRWERVRIRNEQSTTDANAIAFSEEDLIRHAYRFHPPSEGEPHLVYDGCPATVLAALHSARPCIERGAR